MGRLPLSDRMMVEECRSLTVASLVSARIIGPREVPDSPAPPQPLYWPSGFEASALYQENWKGEGKLRLAYTLRGERIEDLIEITAIPSPLGHGRWRYYFNCPGVGGVECGRRVGKLYLPLGESRFACRACHDLTYRSSKEHDKRMDMFRRLSPEDLARALKNPDWNMRHLAFRAALQYIHCRSK
jgi:hypothetical protein